MDPVVTDGQLGRLAVKQHELMTLVRAGQLPVQGALAALQAVIDGRFPMPTLAIGSNYKIWRSIRIGGVQPQELLRQLWAMKAIDRRSDWVSLVLKSPDFAVLPESDEIHLIVLTPRDLGFVRHTFQRHIFDPDKLLTWSKAHLDGHMLALCPAELSAHLRLQYQDQPVGETLRIAGSVSDSGGNAREFQLLSRRDLFWRCLEIDTFASYDSVWTPDLKIVFWLKEVPQGD